MFTGIVEEIGIVRDVSATGLTIAASIVLDDAHLGDSINVQGACLTVARLGDGWFGVDTVPETMRRTTLGTLRTGSRVNLERALAAQGRMGGHVVQGHVEGTGSVMDVTPDGDAVMVTIQAPAAVQRYVVEKGFIAVDGMSLTVVDRDERNFRLTLIPFTRLHTTAGDWVRGSPVNLESDILAKYVESLLRHRYDTGTVTTDGGSNDAH